MIAVLFRWEVKPGYEQSFQECWSEIMHFNIEKYGALGSRLHKSKDNQWISYSQWLSEEHFKNGFKAFNSSGEANTHDAHEIARMKIHRAISKYYEPIVMVPVIDHLLATEHTHSSLLP
jgi:heme-degrading monooxygenase HmoA